MATCDHPSELVHADCIPEPSAARVAKGQPRFRYRGRKIRRYMPHLRACKGSRPVKCFTVSSHRANLRPRSRWAAVGAVAFQALVLVTLVVAPLYRTLPLPKRETVTMLYLQSPASCGWQCHKASSADVGVHICAYEQDHFGAIAHDPRSARSSSGSQRAEWSEVFPVEWSAAIWRRNLRRNSE